MEIIQKKVKRTIPYLRNDIVFNDNTPLKFINTKIENYNEHIFLYGINEHGNSVCAKFHDFRPYFYVYSMDFEENDLEKILAENVVKEDNHLSYIESIGKVSRTPLMGYHPKGTEIIFKITMRSPNYVSMCRKIFETKNIPTYEASTLYIMRFMIDKGFGGFDWIYLNKFKQTTEKQTTCQIEVDVSHYDLEPSKNDPDTGKHVRIMFFDLEIVKKGAGYGGAEIDPIVIISCVTCNGLYETIDSRVFVLVPPGGNVTQPLPNHDVHVEIFEREEAMMIAWKTYVNLIDPDIFSGYNIDGYDWPYLFNRAKALKIYNEFIDFSRHLEKKCSIHTAFFQSAATGARKDFEAKTPGRISCDMLKFVKAPGNRIKLRSYKLGNVLANLLGKNKVEMPYDQIPKYYYGTDEQRAHLCHYGWYDSEACRELMINRMTMVNYVEKARVCGVPMNYIISKGMEELSMSLLLRYAQKELVVVPSSTSKENDEDTDGATVRDPVTGLHNEWVITEDLQSLYPSIIMNENISYDTIVSLAWAKKHLKPDQYNVPPIPNVDYCFVSEDVKVGIVNKIETDLFNWRLQAKADAKKEKDPHKKSVLDSRQNSIKLVMNSFYGFFKGNKVCDKRLMESVTAWGREILERLVELVEREFVGCKVIYGDSVTGDTPVLVKSPQNDICYRTIRTLSDTDEWKDYPQFKSNEPDRFEKEQAELKGWMIWTYDRTLKNGKGKWTPIKRVIRHKTTKKLFRVLTHTGCVDVTEDHSLLDDKCNIVKPVDCKVGSKLLHAELPDMQDLLKLEEEMGDSFSTKNKLEAALYYHYLQTMGYSCFLNAVGDLFIVNICDADDIKEPNAIKKIEQISTTNTKEFVYDIETEEGYFQAGIGEMIVKNTDSIFVKFPGKTMEEAFELGQKAADLCTEMLNEKRKRLGKPYIHLLQREKGFKPIMLVGKKRYAGKRWMTPESEPSFACSGMENIRRDNALIGSETQEKALEMIIMEGDLKGERAVAFIHEQISLLLHGKIEISKLIITKGLSQTFEHYAKSNSKQAHVELAKRIDVRKHITGELGYNTGDRVKYVIVAGAKNAKISEKSEDPIYALENRLTIDYEYYIWNQMMKPLLRILVPILSPGVRLNTLSGWKDGEVENIKTTNKKGEKKDKSLTNIKSLTAYQILFTGEHMRSRIQKSNVGKGNAFGIMKFAKVQQTCIGCGTMSDTSLCSYCELNRQIIYLKLQQEKDKLEQKKWSCWVGCQQCVGEKYSQIIECAQTDCSNFYERQKVIYDIEDLDKKFNKF
jgi:DNA polymerase elongation subunit (family B)